jgi:hypothetical protein
VLPVKLLSPPKTAVIECEPIDKPDVARVALPLLNSVPVPSVAAPSLNVTVPVGVPIPEVGATVAVKVTGCPSIEGLPEEATVEAVAVGGGGGPTNEGTSAFTKGLPSPVTKSQPLPAEKLPADPEVMSR